MKRPNLLILALVVLAAAPAAAQQKEPIGRFAADVRGVFVRHKLEPDIAKGLDVTPENLPSRSFGLVGGAHFYPFRLKNVTFGFGGEFLMAGSHRALDPTTEGGSPSPTIRRHFRSIAPEVSFNFGHKNGWSYVSGGMFGRTTLYADREDSPAIDAPSRSTINYGAGARWFTNHHVAFSVDVRWYSIAEQLPTSTGVVFEPRTTLMVLSGGIGIR